MSNEMLAFGAGALAVAMIALLVARSLWVQRRIRARLSKRVPVAVIDTAAPDSLPKPAEGSGNAPSHASRSGRAEQRKAVMGGCPGASATYRNPAPGTAVKDVMNRSLSIHVFEMVKEAVAPARVK